MSVHSFAEPALTPLAPNRNGFVISTHLRFALQSVLGAHTADPVAQLGVDVEHLAADPGAVTAVAADAVVGRGDQDGAGVVDLVDGLAERVHHPVHQWSPFTNCSSFWCIHRTLLSW